MSVQHFTKDTFQASVLESTGVVLVDFWAQWCGPCQMLGPVIEQLGSEMDGKAVVGKVDIDEQPEQRDQYGITGKKSAAYWVYSPSRRWSR